MSSWFCREARCRRGLWARLALGAAAIRQVTSEAQARVAVGSHMVRFAMYWNIGREILTRQEAVGTGSRGYGAQIITRLAADISADPALKSIGASKRNLQYNASVRGGMAGVGESATDGCTLFMEAPDDPARPSRRPRPATTVRAMECRERLVREHARASDRQQAASVDRRGGDCCCPGYSPLALDDPRERRRAAIPRPARIATTAPTPAAIPRAPQPGPPSVGGAVGGVDVGGSVVDPDDPGDAKELGEEDGSLPTAYSG